MSIPAASFGRGYEEARRYAGHNYKGELATVRRLLQTYR